MHTVQQILETKGKAVFSIAEDATAMDAAKVMNDHHIGALVVTRGEKVVGIFTERDILNRVVAQQRAPAETVVRDVMTTPVACCAPGTSRAECRGVMRGRRIRHLPVVDDQRLVGIISVGDILQDEGAEQQETIRYLYEYMHGEWH
ncbi:MAG TPA: CBS domain-containing protein [Phycisphaerae bacterium]|nr:CBS domain-containing protein [Phycisphaerae bacterium]